MADLKVNYHFWLGGSPSYTKYYRNWRYFTVYFDCFGEEGYFPINDSFTQCVNNVYYCCFIWSLFGTLCSIQFLLFIFTYEDMSTPKYTFFVYWIRWGMRTVLNVSVKPCLSKGGVTIARGPTPWNDGPDGLWPIGTANIRVRPTSSLNLPWLKAGDPARLGLCSNTL